MAKILIEISRFFYKSNIDVQSIHTKTSIKRADFSNIYKNNTNDFSKYFNNLDNM